MDLLLLWWVWRLIAIPAAATQTQPFAFSPSVFLHLILQTNKHTKAPFWISKGSSVLPFPSGAGVSHFPSQHHLLHHYSSWHSCRRDFGEDTKSFQLGRKMGKQHLQFSTAFWQFQCIWQEHAKPCSPERRRIKTIRNKFLVLSIIWKQAFLCCFCTYFPLFLSCICSFLHKQPPVQPGPCKIIDTLGLGGELLLI